VADFAIDVSAWVRQATDRMDAAFRAIAFDAVTEVQLRTPVDTGYLRSNWTAILAGEQEPKAGATPPASDAIARAKAGQVITILNPVIYARRIEFGFVGEDSLGRSYHQMGRHMVQQTIAELPQIAERAVERIMGGGSAVA
jgi:hypothetical protein